MLSAPQWFLFFQKGGGGDSATTKPRAKLDSKAAKEKALGRREMPAACERGLSERRPCVNPRGCLHPEFCRKLGLRVGTNLED